MATEVIEHLITKLSFVYDDIKLEKFDKWVDSASKGLMGMVAGFSAASAGMFAFTKSIVETNDELGKTSLRLGVDVKRLQELGFAAEINGASIDSMNGSLSRLSEITSEMARGVGAGVEIFGMLGLSATGAGGKIKKADDLLLEISDSISQLGTQAEKLEFVRKLGINEDLLLMLQNGSGEIRALVKEAKELGFAFDEKAARAAADFNDELLRTQKIGIGLANIIGTKMMESMLPTLKAFTNWYKINKDLIQQKVDVYWNKLLSVLNAAHNIGFRVLRFVDGIAKSMGGWETTIKALTVSFIALNASALLMPTLIALGAASIFLLLEDLKVFAEEGDSAIGNLIERFPQLEPYVLTLLDLLGMVKTGWVLIFTEGDKALEGMILMIKNAIAWVKRLIEDIKKSVNELKKLPSKFDPFSDVNMEKLNEWADDLWRWAPWTPPKDLTPVPSIGGATTTVSNSNTTNTSNTPVTINIHGGDISKVKQAVKDVLSEKVTGAIKNLDSQVEY